jgi:hypothetical protein
MGGKEGVMPKEIVLEGPGYGPPDPDSQGVVQVGWNPEAEDVQVATFSRHPTSYETNWNGFFVGLDRRGINDLIRYLRRARDQAFGRDE